MPRTFTQLYYHIVFSTKERLPLLTPQIVDGLYPLFGAVIRDQGGALLAVGGMPDHVHLLTGLKAHPSVSAVVKAVKGSSSHWINQNHTPLMHFAWQEGYSAFSVSTSNLLKVRRYIEHQESHHQRSSFEREMVGLLTKHGIEVKPEDL